MLSEVVDQIIEQGEEKKARETARRMLVEGISVEVISRVTGLPVAEIRELSQDSDNGRQ